MAQNENYSQVDLRVGTEAQFNAKVDTLPAGTLFGVTDATVSKADLSTDLKNEINGKITQPSNPTGDSAVVINSNGVVSTKLLSDIGSGITVNSELSDSSENPVQNKVISSALNSFAKKSSSNTFTQQNTFQAQTNFTNYTLYNPESSNYGFTYQCNGNVNNEVEIYGGDGTSTKGRVVVHGGNNAYHKTEYTADQIRVYTDKSTVNSQLYFPSNSGTIALKQDIKPLYMHVLHLTRTNTTSNTGFSVYATIYTRTKTKITNTTVLTMVLGSGNWVACNGYLTDGTYDVVMTLGTTYIRPLKAADVQLVNNVNWDDTVVEL